MDGRVLELSIDFADNVLVVSEALWALSVRLAGAGRLVALVVEGALAQKVDCGVVLQFQFAPADVALGVGEQNRLTLKHNTFEILS